jgi:tight adherence protein B
VGAVGAVLSTWLVSVCVTCAAWCVVVPGGRCPAGLVDSSGARAGRGPGRRWRRLSRSPEREPDQVRVAVAQVGALLRSGASPATAWSRALGVPVDAEGVPDREALAAAVGGIRPARAVVAAARLAREVGAPLGGVLESVGAALVAQAEADAEREASLAGPQATARVLLWLPALGAVLGTVLGADPLATATDGGVGTSAVLLGVLALLAGRAWTRHLVSAARTAGAEP